MSPWTPLGSPYSCTESHCWWGHHSRPEGGSHFIRAVYQGLREERGITSCGDSKLLNSPPPPQKIQRFVERSQRCSGVTEKTESSTGRVHGRWHLPVWFSPGCCSPWGRSPGQSIWSQERMVSSHRDTSHKLIGFHLDVKLFNAVWVLSCGQKRNNYFSHISQEVRQLIWNLKKYSNFLGVSAH